MNRYAKKQKCVNPSLTPRIYANNVIASIILPMKAKGGCVSATTFESRKKQGIPEFNNLRLCAKHPPAKEPSVKGLVLLNPSEKDVKELIKGFDQLLIASV